MRLALALVSLTLLAGCSSSSSGETPQGAGGSTAAPAVGTVEGFAELPSATEGLAVGADEAGAPVVYTGSANAVWRVGVDKKPVKVVDLPGPLGMAVRANGTLLVCGKAEGDFGKNPPPAVVWAVTPAGVKSLFVAPASYKLTNMLAVAPDDTVVFSDSGAGKVFHASADGAVVTELASISYANGVAFSRDGKTVYVASYDTMKIHAFARDGAGFSAPTVFAEGVANVDGITQLASGDLILVMTGAGIVRYGADAARTIAPAASIGLPANGAFGKGALGDGWLYVTNLLGKTLSRVYVGEPGAPLPVR